MIQARESEQPAVNAMDVTADSRGTAQVRSEEDFFQIHAKAVYAYALRRVGRTHSAEDIVAEVFVEAIKNSRSRNQKDPLPWLYGIARRKVADHHRQVNRKPSASLYDSLAATSPGPDQVLEQAQQSLELRKLVARLPEDQREALLLHYVEGLSAVQISTSMSRSVAAVNSLLQRARESIRAKGSIHFEE